jgi:N-acetylglutamate synthase-like GNAT family acetyltransferase
MNDFAYEVRVARPEDAEAVTRLLEASYPELLPSAYDAQFLERALKLITRANPKLLSSGTYYVAENADGLLVGCGGWTRERPGTAEVEPHLGHIRHFGTHPAWIRRGVGRAIYSRCRDTARVAGVRTFEAYAGLNAETFYHALGFERVREIDVELQPQLVMHGILMRREIS